MDSLTLKNVKKQYKNFTLNNVSFTLPQGEIMGFIGENGAGKSTTINLILNLIKKDDGQITVMGEDNVKALDKMKEQIGVVLDECCFAETLTARHVGNMMKTLYKTWDGHKYEEYIRRFSLPTICSIKEFSKGMKMKLSIAVALSHDSKLLILDEATSGLDPIARDEILDILQEFTLNEEHSVFLSSHIVSDLEKICDSITFIHKGSIIFSSYKDELLDSYKLIKCSQKDLALLDPSIVIGKRKNSFGAEVLVKQEDNAQDFTVKGSLDKGTVIEKASIEDIMLFYVKEGIER